MVDQEVRHRGQDVAGGANALPPVIKTGSADGVSDRRPQPGQRLDQLTGKASDERTKMEGDDGGD